MHRQTLRPFLFLLLLSTCAWQGFGCTCSEKKTVPAEENPAEGEQAEPKNTAAEESNASPETATAEPVEEAPPQEEYSFITYQKRLLQKAQEGMIAPGPMEPAVSAQELALGPQPLALRIEATSVLEEHEHIGLHAPERLLDGDPKTAWCEGRLGEKSFESATIWIPDAVFGRDFDQLRFTPGWQKDTNTFVRYARAKKYILVWIGRDGQAVSIQEVPLSKLMDPVFVTPDLPKGTPIAGVRLLFKEHYPVGWIGFLCVSEWEFMLDGKPAKREQRGDELRRKRLKWLESLDKNANNVGYRYIVAQNTWIRSDSCDDGSPHVLKMGLLRYYDDPGNLEEYVPVKMDWEDPFVVLTIGEGEMKEIESCRYTFCPAPSCKAAKLSVKKGKVACMFCGSVNVEGRTRDHLWYAFE